MFIVLVIRNKDNLFDCNLSMTIKLCDCLMVIRMKLNQFKNKKKNYEN